MRRALRLVVLLIVGLAILTWNASHIVNDAARRWFERDMTLRARLPVNGARRALVSDWRVKDGARIQSLLQDLARDERVMGAAACELDGKLLAKTGEFPTELPCSEILRHVEPSAGNEDWKSWTE